MGGGAVRIDLTPIPRYKFAVEIVRLCVLLYVRLGCGLRSAVKILEIFSEVLGPAFGNAPCHKTVEDRVKKLGLSVYEDDPTPEETGGYAIVQDESIWVNKEKLLLTLGMPADFLNRPVGHADARILDMRVGNAWPMLNLRTLMPGPRSICPKIWLLDESKLSNKEPNFRASNFTP